MTDLLCLSFFMKKYVQNFLRFRQMRLAKGNYDKMIVDKLRYT